MRNVLFQMALKIFLSFFAVTTLAHAADFDLKTQVEVYKLRYGLRNPDEKLIDNHGNGFEPLYGVRNFRVVLHGVYYRGGGNNAYHRNGRRNNENPLPNDGLKHLCEEGFKEAIYLYSKNFSRAPKVTTCRARSGEDSQLKYQQFSALEGKNEETLLRKVYDHIKGNVTGPIYDHCWNGWHASGYVAAITLKQFCGYSNEKADAYWVKNTDGHERGMGHVRSKLKAFKPLRGLEISDEEKDLICP